MNSSIIKAEISLNCLSTKSGEYQSREDRALRPFLRVLSDIAFDGRPEAHEREQLAAATVELVGVIRDEISRVVLADQIVQTTRGNHTRLVG
ncbi:MAG: hypothetical protein ACOC8C_00525 [Chloroflexota bacterium]